MRYLINESTDPYFNMAFDEYNLEHLALEEPVFYLWRNRPSVIIGMNQNAYSEVNLKYLDDHGILLVRRVTGGGAVYHDLQNLNYSIIGRSTQLETDYPEYATAVPQALRAIGLDAEISGRNDILVGGRKISGFAKRVWKDRILVHGTLMYDVDIDTLSKVLDAPGNKMKAAGIASVRSKVANIKDCLPEMKSIDGLQQALQRILAGNDGPMDIEPDAIEAIKRLSKEKFETWDWIYGHSPLAEFRHSGKFACGRLEASFCVERGVLKNISFGGDFLGNLPAEELAAALEGCSYEPEALLSAIRAMDPGAYFDGISPEELRSIFLA